MNEQYLRDVVTAVKEANDDAFNMDVWIGKTCCKTIGCAIGIYTQKYPTRELRIPRRGVPLLVADGNHYAGFEAIEKHFDIDIDQALYLFSSFRYPDRMNISRADVIARIEAFIDSGGEIAGEQSNGQ